MLSALPISVKLFVSMNDIDTINPLNSPYLYCNINRNICPSVATAAVICSDIS